jgi:hypothetical protein
MNECAIKLMDVADVSGWGYDKEPVASKTLQKDRKYSIESSFLNLR